MPFQSEAQRRYLWANEPEIARDWTDTYGSRIQKNNGGIMRIPFQGGGRDASQADFGGSSNTGAVDDHSYKTHHPNIHAGMTTQNVVTPSGDVFNTGDPTLSEKQDYFNQAWSGQPNFLGFGGGYRNLKTPNDAGSGYQSRLNPENILGILGGFINKPFSLAATGFNALRDRTATGINAVRNKFGPAWNDWTDADNLEEFLRRRRTGETITNPAVRGEYGLPAINIEEEPNDIENFTSNNQNLEGIDDHTAFLPAVIVQALAAVKSGGGAKKIGEILLQDQIQKQMKEKMIKDPRSLIG